MSGPNLNQFVFRGDVRVNAAGVQQVYNEIRNVDNSVTNIYRVSMPRATQASDRFAQRVRQGGFALERLGVRGTAAFGEIYAAAGVVGVAIGGVIAVVVALTAALGALAIAGIKAIKNLAVESIEVGKQIQSALAQFTAFFEGNVAAAEATVSRLQAVGAEFGITDALTLGQAFLPEVSDLDQLDKIVKIAAALRQFQPEQEAFVRQTLQDLLAGQTRSLVQRFEISPEAAQKIRDAFQLDGEIGALIALEEELERTGRSIENFADTASVQSGRVEARLQILRGIIGEPVAEQLTESLKSIVQLIDDNAPAFEKFGVVFGSSLAAGAESVFNFIDGAIRQFVAAEESIDDVFGLVAIIIQQVEQFLAIISGTGANDVNVFSFVANKLKLIGLAIAGVMNIINIGVATIRANIITLIEAVRFAVAVLKGEDAAAAFSGLIDALTDSGQVIIDTFKSLPEGFRELGMDVDDYSESLRRANEEGEEAANTLLTEKDAARELAAQLEEVAAARDSIQGALTEFNIEFNRDIDDLLREQEEERLDLEREFARKREDISTDHFRRQADIARDFYDNQVDAATDFARKEEDILRDRGRDILDLEEDIAKDRIKIEDDLQAELARINRRFDFNRRQFIRDNDAVGFVRNEEQRAFELNEARLSAQEQREEAAKAAEEKRNDLKVQLDRELEDAQITNRRKLEDLITNLNRELAENQKRLDRELEDQDTFEDRKIELQEEAFEREQEALDLRWERKLEDLERKYAEELAILEDFQRREIQLVLDHQSRLAQIQGGAGLPAALGGQGTGLLPPGGGGATLTEGDPFSSNNAPSTDDLRVQARDLALRHGLTELLPIIAQASRAQLLSIIASLGGGVGGSSGGSSGGGGNIEFNPGHGAPRRDGGPLFANRDYLFEGREPEIIRFGQHGRVVPMRQLPLGALGGGGGSVTNNSFEVNQSMLDPSQVSPIQRAIMRSYAIEIVDEVIGRL